MEQLVIVGSGPAGATAAIYTARAGLKPVVITGMQPGGQLTTTTEVENYPGFPEGIQGPELMENMRKQAEKFGAEFRIAEVTAVTAIAGGAHLAIPGGDIDTQALIIATGSSPRKVGIMAEDRLAGRGVSYCATCDGFFFKGKVIAVVGGGDSALEEAQFLARFGTTVYLVHRREAFRASAAMQAKSLGKPNVKPLYNRVVVDLKGDKKLTAMVIEDPTTHKREEIAVDGLFVAIGHDPNSAVFKGVIDRDDKGYIKTDGHTRTRTPGVFACGDVVDHHFMQAVTAAGTGCMAAIETVRYLDERAGKTYPGRG
ncbi:MAG: thioredoxin-disulfide reductase [Planctomycetota bacterium]